MIRPLFIFDLDGTLANAEHRIHFIQRPACPFCGWNKRCAHDNLTFEQLADRGMPQGRRDKFAPDWREFFAAAKDDTPIPALIATFKSLRKSGADCWIWTGRSDEVRQATVQWLIDADLFGKVNKSPLTWMLSAAERFLMRKAGDHRPDHELKFEWLANLEPPERSRLTPCSKTAPASCRCGATRACSASKSPQEISE